MLESIKYSKEKDFDKWYQEILIKCDIIEYYDISGCYIMKEEPVAIWENMQNLKNLELRICIFHYLFGKKI